MKNLKYIFAIALIINANKYNSGSKHQKNLHKKNIRHYLQPGLGFTVKRADPLCPFAIN